MAMTPEMEAAFALDNPQPMYQESAVTQGQPEEAEMTPGQAVGMGMGMAEEYMKSNGPPHATHLARAKTMTRGQLEEQMKNEKDGYPSNLEEADKVKQLETKVEQIEGGVHKILAHLTNLGGATPIRRNPVNFPKGEESTVGHVVPTNPQPTLQPEPQLQPRTVTLKNGKVVVIPTVPSRAMGLGPAGDENPPASDLEVGAEDLWAPDQPAIAGQVAIPADDEPAEDPRMVQLEALVSGTIEFLRSHDPHKVWRKHLVTHLHRHMGYSGWPRKFQGDFDRRFQAYLSDSQFITTTCRKVLNMELGDSVGVQWVATMAVIAAGWMAFAMSGLDS